MVEDISASKGGGQRSGLSHLCIVPRWAKNDRLVGFENVSGVDKSLGTLWWDTPLTSLDRP